MTSVSVRLYPVSFTIASGPAQLLTLEGEDGSLAASGTDDPATVAGKLLHDVFAEIEQGFAPGASARASLPDLIDQVQLAGVSVEGGGAELIFTAAVPTPLAEPQLDISTGSRFAWRSLRGSSGKRVRGGGPDHVDGDDAVVLDYWRQAFEETDAALDFLPRHLTLLQLRSLYDAVWGYDQDASGFKRWAVDRTGAFAQLLDEVPDGEDLDSLFYESLGQRLSASEAAAAGAMSRGSMREVPPDGTGLALAFAAATTVNRLWARPGPEPTWYRKSTRWRSGPHWIANVYPPRPSWTRWELP